MSRVVQGPACRIVGGQGRTVTRGNDIFVAIPLSQFGNQFRADLSGRARNQYSLHA